MSKNKLRNPKKYRVYVGWPNGFVSHETVTELKSIARYAYSDLLFNSDSFFKADYITMTFDHKKVEYYEIKK